MQAIEFIAKAQKGSIKVPKEYHEQLQGQFRVIILQEQEAIVPKKSTSKKRTLNAVKIKTKGFKFNRDEANAR
jgi:hypothetical protein